MSRPAKGEDARPMRHHSPRVGDREDSGRLEAFSDGVFAIAITLLILDIKVPMNIPPGVTLGEALVAQWPVYVAFLNSFLFIGIMWMNHHRLFTMIRPTDHWLLVINGILLLGVCIVPFPTSLLTEYIGKPGERTAAMIYSATFLVATILAWFSVPAHHVYDGPGGVLRHSPAEGGGS